MVSAFKNSLHCRVWYQIDFVCAKKNLCRILLNKMWFIDLSLHWIISFVHCVCNFNGTIEIGPWSFWEVSLAYLNVFCTTCCYWKKLVNCVTYKSVICLENFLICFKLCSKVFLSWRLLHTYMGSPNKKASGATVLYNGFRFVLGYRDWPTLNTQWRRLSWTEGVLYLPARCPLPDDI